MSSPRVLQRRVAFTVGAAIMPIIMTSTSVLLTVGEARAESAPPGAFGYSVAASADAMTMDVQTGLFGDVFPLVPSGEPPMTGSAAHTEAVFDDLGNNSSLASAPYPGAFAAGMAGTFRAVSRPGGQPGIGQAPPLPDWPFIVTSTYPGREESAQTNGPYTVSAASGPAGSLAAATVGALGPGAVLSPASRSEARWDASAEKFVAKADSSFAALTLDPVLKLVDVEAHVTLAAAPGEKPSTTSSFEVGTMTVGGVKVGLTDKGFIVGPNAGPSPNPGPLSAVLAAAGITIEFIPAQTTTKGIRSAGMRITSTQEFPVQGRVTQTWTAGLVSASLDPGVTFDAYETSSYGPYSADPEPTTSDPECQPGWKRFGKDCYPNVAIITPTLGFFSFGATFGGPIMCFMGTSAVGSIGRGAGASQVSNEVGKAATPYCSSGPNRFGDGMAELDGRLGPLTAINPVVNPVLDAMAEGSRDFATSHGSTIAPFGPSAYQMGAFFEYFKGS